MSALLVRVMKADGGRNSEGVPNLVLEVGPAAVVFRGDLKATNARFVEDAQKIVDGLSHSLPGGTLDQVLRLLLERKASQLVVRE